MHSLWLVFGLEERARTLADHVFFKLEKASNAAETLRAVTKDARKSAELSQPFVVVVRCAGCDCEAQTEEEYRYSASRSTLYSRSTLITALKINAHKSI